MLLEKRNQGEIITIKTDSIQELCIIKLGGNKKSFKIVIKNILAGIEDHELDIKCMTPDLFCESFHPSYPTSAFTASFVTDVNQCS